MSEICLDCLNQEEGTHYTEKDVILSEPDDLDLCESCGEMKQVVVCFRKPSIFSRLRERFSYWRYYFS